MLYVTTDSYLGGSCDWDGSGFGGEGFGGAMFDLEPLTRLPLHASAEAGISVVEMTYTSSCSGSSYSYDGSDWSSFNATVSIIWLF